MSLEHDRSIDDADRRGVGRAVVTIAGGTVPDAGLLVLPDLEAEPELRLPTTTRHAQLAPFQRHRLLWVPVGEDGNVFRARPDGQLMVAAVPRASAVGGGLTPDGDILHLDGAASAARILGWALPIAVAVPSQGQPLHLIEEPRIELA